MKKKKRHTKPRDRERVIKSRKRLMILSKGVVTPVDLKHLKAAQSKFDDENKDLLLEVKREQQKIKRKGKAV